MESTPQPATTSKGMLWAGRIVSALVALFMIFDGTIKVMKTPAAVQGTSQLGYPASVVFPLGIVVLVCVALYAIPRTSVLGAVLLTGYLGGAVATMVRVQSPQYLFPAVIGVVAWLGIFLRDGRLRALIPLRGPVRS